MVKKQRNFWMDDDTYKRLVAKAQAAYKGKGFLERYIEEIANNNILILRGSRVKIEIEKVG